MEIFLEASGKTSVVRTEIYPLIEKQMANNWPKIKKEIGKYKTDNHEYLYAQAPYYRIPFTQKEYDAFYKALGLSEKQLEGYMKKTFFYGQNINPRCAKNPFTAAMICIIRYHLKKKNERDAKLSSVYLAFSGQFYPSAHSLFFKYLPNQNIMDYVVNNKISDKYQLRKAGTVFGAMELLCDTWISTYQKDILGEFDDDDYARTIVQQLHDRVKASIKNIALLYYDAHDKDEYMNYSADSVEEDNYHLTNANSVRADKYTEQAINYMTTKEVNYKHCGMVIDQNIKKDEIKNIMSSIYHNNDNIADLRKVVNILIADFMNQYPEEPISGVKFINYSMAIKPNTKDEDRIFVRETIIKWLNDNSIDYVRRKSRQATAVSYYKAVLKMIVLSINAACK